MINNQTHESHYILGTKTLNYDSNVIEAASIEDFLIPSNYLPLLPFLTSFSE